MAETFEYSALIPAVPEIVLTIGAMVLLMVGAFRGERTAGSIDLAAILLLVGCGLLVLLLPEGRLVTFGGSFIVDGFARFLKLLALTGSATAVLMSLDYLRAEGQRKFEYSILIVLSTVGMMMLISAGDLIALYLGLELMSLPLYVIAASNRENVKSTEAGLKYFVLGALSSGMLLYGASLIYGFTGTVSFAGIAKATQSGASIGLIFGLVFLFVGFCFKISAVPFHMWTPDVYEGAPTPVVAFFAAAPKLAAMVLFARVLVEGFPGAIDQWKQVLVAIALISVAVGAFAGLVQKNLKRLWAYSSIANIGYATLGLASGTEEGVQAMLVFMVLYMIDVTGFFACLIAMSRGGRPMDTLPSLAGLAVIAAIAFGYVLFVVFISRRGREAVRLMTEVALAQEIHASLVPALQHADDRLQVDASSTASGEMGGDLVDMVERGATTDLVLADVSGHGVKAGVVMGMVKAALRMAQRDERGLAKQRVRVDVDLRVERDQQALLGDDQRVDLDQR